jgi:hypothetical protein
VQTKLVIFTLLFYSSAECPSPVAAGNGLGTTSKYLRRIRNGAAGNGLGTAIK